MIEVGRLVERHHVGVETRCDGKRLLGRRAMRLVDRDIAPLRRFPMRGERRVDLFIKLA
ncbi:hypothetical protein W911_16520 [Hyphomicrobium nitrativorans NL23]|uniref:Uncharacterized protein n=1 Tax=Hyphomicrobium nitrativorans NL23 TaxID=1029756 RepID=V5SIU9_9HYPH|nr:hypothetical protein W911_16520 [Hyphomicrobium nitrativorans NL23]